MQYNNCIVYSFTSLSSIVYYVKSGFCKYFCGVFYYGPIDEQYRRTHLFIVQLGRSPITSLRSFTNSIGWRLWNGLLSRVQSLCWVSLRGSAQSFLVDEHVKARLRVKFFPQSLTPLVNLSSTFKTVALPLLVTLIGLRLVLNLDCVLDNTAATVPQPLPKSRSRIGCIDVDDV